MLLTIVINLVLFGPTFETPTNTEEALAQGIIFHEEKKILITEKFINAEFLVPFPRIQLFGTTPSRDPTSRTLNEMDYTVRVLQHDIHYYVPKPDRFVQC